MWLAPRPFLIGAKDIPFIGGKAVISRRIPTGSTWRFKYPLIKYTDTVIAGAQTSPDLTFQLFDQAQLNFADVAPRVKLITTPAGFAQLDETQSLNIDFAGGASVKAEVFGQAAGLPASVSICLYGLLGWQWV